ncbi:MAG: hypothetical protein QM610_09395 [Chitinophagaceae bacterium]
MKKRILSILAIAFVVANAYAANVVGNDGNGKKEDKVERVKDVNVKYVGETSDNGIVFDVNYANPTGQRFILVISNSQGEVLFNQSFKGADFHKTVMIKKDSDAVGNVKFAVKSNGNELYSQAFQIDMESHFVNNVVVKAIN